VYDKFEESIDDDEEVPFALHVVTCDDKPPHSINGPCDTLEDVLRHMMVYFEVDEQGFMHRK
jgi:hypothetical protein